MQYNKFIQSSYGTIKKSREIGLDCRIHENTIKIPVTPSNVYIEIWVEKGKQKIKIEQWNFKCQKTLMQSQYEQDQDPQLDSVELLKKSYTTLLEQSLARFNPKLLIRTIQPKQLTISISTSQTNLKPFSQPHVFFISIDEYEGNGFNCQVSLQTIHTEMNRKKQFISLSSDQEQFIDLVDSSYEKERVNQYRSSQRKSETSPEIKSYQNIQRIQQKQIKHSVEKSQEQAASSAQTQKNISLNQSPQQRTHSINKSHKQMVNMLLSKYSTKQIKVSDYQRKMQILNQTIQLIEQLDFKNDMKVGSFLRRLQ